MSGKVTQCPTCGADHDAANAYHKALGAKAERARIVAWLRKLQATRVEERPSRLDELAFVQLNIIADAIERGDRAAPDGGSLAAEEPKS